MGPKGQVLMTPSLSPEVQEQPAPPKQKKFSYSLSGVIGALPFFAFVAAFLIIPILTNVLKAFQDPAGNPSTASMTEAMGTGYRSRSEEHTSELQSRGHLVCRLLLEKKK